LNKSPIVAIVGVKAIRIEDIWVPLVELGGDEIIQDVVLNIALENEVSSRGIKISNNEIGEERKLLSSMSPSLSQDDFNELMTARGFGKQRQEELLWRNAALRKLIANKVKVTDEAIERMFSILHGPSYPARIIVVTTIDEASSIKSKLEGGESFTKLANDYSIDPSAKLGGFVSPISIADPSWPSPIREALSELTTNEFSNPIFIGDRWVILTVTDDPISSDKTREEVDSEIRKLAKLSQERFLMEELANNLIKQQHIKIIDSNLKGTLSSDIYYSE
jgi:foldase protein PrsA